MMTQKKTDASADEIVERTSDIAWFVSHCIAKSHRHRWTHMLLESPQKAGAEMHKFEMHLDEAKCVPVKNMDIEKLLGRNLDKLAGTYVGRDGTAIAASLGFAIAQTSPWQFDTLFCSARNAVAVFFHHEGGTWVCTGGRAATEIKKGFLATE